MQKLDKLYEGKAKKLYATDDPDVLWVEYMNQATAGNGAKKAQIEGKGELNNQITSVIFDLLKARGIDSHFVKRISDTEQLVRKMDMYPLEIIMRNTAAGSFAKRYGVEEGTALDKPILEFCVKSDELGDPFINDDGIVALGIASEEELDEISRQARAVNDALKDGRILLADEITPDTCRLWDLKDGSGQIEHLDKDLFRRDLGNIIPAYEEIYDRLVKLAEAEGVERAE